MDKTWIGKTTYENNLTKKVKIAKKNSQIAALNKKQSRRCLFAQIAFAQSTLNLECKKLSLY